MTNFNWILWVVVPIIIAYYLYRRVWPMLRKFIRLFQGIRLNPRSRLTEAEYKKLCVGSLYALQQGAYLNSLTLDIKDKLSTILSDWWGICNTQDAKQTLEYLSEKGFAYYFPYVYQAFLLEDEKAQDQIFQQHMTSQEDYDKAVEQLHNLEECYDELLECGTITCREDLLRYGVTGWDAGRLNFMARACYDMKYISEAEAWHYIDRAYEMAHDRFSSWHDLAMSYVIGRALWGGKSASNSGMMYMANDLLESKKAHGLKSNGNLSIIFKNNNLIRGCPDTPRTSNLLMSRFILFFSLSLRCNIRILSFSIL